MFGGGWGLGNFSLMRNLWCIHIFPQFFHLSHICLYLLLLMMVFGNCPSPQKPDSKLSGSATAGRTLTFVVPSTNSRLLQSLSIFSQWAWAVNLEIVTGIDHGSQPRLHIAISRWKFYKRQAMTRFSQSQTTMEPLEWGPSMRAFSPLSCYSAVQTCCGTTERANLCPSP